MRRQEGEPLAAAAARSVVVAVVLLAAVVTWFIQAAIPRAHRDRDRAPRRLLSPAGAAVQGAPRARGRHARGATHRRARPRTCACSRDPNSGVDVAFVQGGLGADATGRGDARRPLLRGAVDLLPRRSHAHPHRPAARQAHRHRARRQRHARLCRSRARRQRRHCRATPRSRRRRTPKRYARCSAATSMPPSWWGPRVAQSADIALRDPAIKLMSIVARRRLSRAASTS